MKISSRLWQWNKNNRPHKMNGKLVNNVIDSMEERKTSTVCDGNHGKQQQEINLIWSVYLFSHISCTFRSHLFFFRRSRTVKCLALFFVFLLLKCEQVNQLIYHILCWMLIGWTQCQHSNDNLFIFLSTVLT